MQPKAFKVTLGHIFKPYAYTNDIQKMIYYVLKYADVEFDFDRDIDPPKRTYRLYQYCWKKTKEYSYKFVMWLPNKIKETGLYKFAIENKIGN